LHEYVWGHGVDRVSTGFVAFSCVYGGISSCIDDQLRLRIAYNAADFLGIAQIQFVTTERYHVTQSWQQSIEFGA
jgi:hypothetical protein